jgi:phosphoribosyl 1,2-cyclic phosphodiesterase
LTPKALYVIQIAGKIKEEAFFSFATIQRRDSSIIKASVLGSGSSGNAIFLESANTKVLIDVGFNATEISKRLEIIGRSPKDLNAILITHEHIDHIRGAGAVARKYDIPIYLNPDTYEAAETILGDLPKVEYFSSGHSFALHDLIVEPFSLPHDASDPNGFNIYWDRVKVSIALDLGYVTRLVKERLQKAQLVILESNHDPEMLKIGPYPWPLKQRISSKLGHLSNQVSSTLLAEIAHSQLFGIILVHLSQVNNDPTLARITIENSLLDHTPKLMVSCQDKPTPLISIDNGL